MTKEELRSLIPIESMVYSKKENVGYTFMGIDKNGKYQLYGLPCAYDEYIMLNSFKIDKTQ
jgi:hypothetical protein